MRKRKRETPAVASPWVLHLFMLIPTAVGIAILAFWIADVRRGLAARSWPSVPGVVEEAATRRKPPVYRYEVGGREYQGFRSSYGGRRVRRNKGDAVTVHFNPEDPNEAVLHPGWSWRSLGIPVFAGLFLLVTGLMWTAGARKR
jgi:hypothetical protein